VRQAELERLFIERFGESKEGVRTFFAPGRVNLIGDHTDYNGGLVFPCAIHYGTTLLIRPTTNKTYQLASTNFDLFAVLSKDQVNEKYGDHWINASISVVTAFAINELFDCGLDKIDIIKMAQSAENDFVGVQCGVMDQYAVTMGESDYAMMLNCESLACEQIPLDLGENAIVLINTNQRRELSESKYNERVIERSGERKVW